MSSTLERDALLQEILVRPGDDLPRRILADWYEEHGTPAEAAHADFLREGLADPGREWVLSFVRDGADVGASDQELLLRVGSLPLFSRLPLPARREDSGVAYAFRRGMLAGVKLPQDWWLSHGKDLARAHPWWWWSCRTGRRGRCPARSYPARPAGGATRSATTRRGTGSGRRSPRTSGAA